MHFYAQHFLTAHKTIAMLIGKTSIRSGDKVIEIGPGKGHITKQLLQSCGGGYRYGCGCGSLIVVEIDPLLCKKLAYRFPGTPGLRIICRDFIKWPLPTTGPYKIFSNIPFNRTTAILKKICTSPNPPIEAWLVMEKGAAKRFMGIPHETAASCFIKKFYKTKIIWYFNKLDFHPPPSVDTVLLHLYR